MTKGYAFQYAPRYIRAFKKMKKLPKPFTSKQYREKVEIDYNCATLESLRGRYFLHVVEKEPFEIKTDDVEQYYYYRGVKISEESYHSLYKNATPTERETDFEIKEDHETINSVRYYYMPDEEKIKRYLEQYKEYKKMLPSLEQELAELEDRCIEIKNAMYPRWSEIF